MDEGWILQTLVTESSYSSSSVHYVCASFLRIKVMHGPLIFEWHMRWRNLKIVTKKSVQTVFVKTSLFHIKIFYRVCFEAFQDCITSLTIHNLFFPKVYYCQILSIHFFASHQLNIRAPRVANVFLWCKVEGVKLKMADLPSQRKYAHL